MQPAVFDAQAGRGEARGASLSALRLAEFLELIRLRWLAEAGAERAMTDKEAPSTRSCAWNRH